MGRINNPDDAEASEIVLPDGATASEVVAPDGSVIWSAIPDAVVDDFEDGNLSEWTDTGSLSITTSPVLEGNESLAITDNSNLAYSLSGDGLGYYPQKGDKFSCLFYDSDGVNFPTAAFGVGTNTNGLDGYSFHIAADFNEFDLRKYEDGSVNNLLAGSASLSTSKTYELEIQWHDGSGSLSEDTLEITLYETDESADLTNNLGRVQQLGNETTTDSAYTTNTGVGAWAESSVSGDAIIDRYWYLGSVD